MPKRTNPFQELVHRIQVAFSSKGDTVTVSAMVKPEDLEEEREIDILRETSKGTRRIKIAVEAKDERRPMDLIKFDSYLGKYRCEGRVAVDEIVIITRRGFSKSVKKKALLTKVTLLTLDNAINYDWSKTAAACGELRPESNFILKLSRISTLILSPPIEEDVEKKAFTEGHVVCPAGGSHGSPIHLASQLVHLNPQPAIREWVNKLIEQSKTVPSAWIGFQFDMSSFRLWFRGIMYPLTSMEVRVSAINAEGPAICTPYEMKSSDGTENIIHEVTSSCGGLDLKLVMTNGLQSPQISLNVTPSKQAEGAEKDNTTPKQRAVKRKNRGKRRRD